MHRTRILPAALLALLLVLLVPTEAIGQASFTWSAKIYPGTVYFFVALLVAAYGSWGGAVRLGSLNLRLDRTAGSE